MYKYKILSSAGSRKTQETIKAVILSHPENFSLCGQFASAIDALEIAPMLKPDIILLSDIMPFIDLPTFIHGLAKRGLRISYILFTNRPESLSYAKMTSLIDGVIPEETLTSEALFHLLQETYIDGKTNTLSRNQAETRSTHMDVPWMEDCQLFAQLLSTFAISTESSPLEFACRKGYLIIAVPRHVQGAAFSFFHDLSHTDLFMKNARLLMESYGRGNLFIIQENKLGIWIEPSCTISELNMFFVEFCDNLNSIFDDSGNVSLAYQRSDKQILFEDLSQAYRAIDHLCKYRFFVDERTILTSDWLQTHSETITQDNVQNLLNGLESSFDASDLTDVQHYIDDLFFYAQKSLSFNSYAYIWNQLIFWYNTKVRQYQLPTDLYIPSFGHDSFSHLADAQNAMANLIKELFFAKAAANLQERNSYVSQAITYLNTHITEPVTLSDAAEHIHISTAYLSQLFQRELGKTFTSVRMELRIKLAKNLLKKNHKIYEVSSMAGFNNEKYFSHTFKRIVGMTPRDYRQQNEVETE